MYATMALREVTRTDTGKAAQRSLTKDHSSKNTEAENGSKEDQEEENGSKRHATVSEEPSEEVPPAKKAKGE